MSEITPSPWNSHYTKGLSSLAFPDENLVRFLANETHSVNAKALDLGCGSGRHIPLLSSFGYSVIGSDLTENAMNLSKPYTGSLVQCHNKTLPFRSNSFHCVCAWGSLHYCHREESILQINEIYRILAPGGVLFGTLRAENDTFFERIEKIDSSWLCRTESLTPLLVTFFNEDELPGLFSGFSTFSHGYCARTQPGKKSLIAHWYFRAQK